HYFLCCSLTTSHSISTSYCFFFTHAAPTEIYTLSLHGALPILNCYVLSDFYEAFVCRDTKKIEKRLTPKKVSLYISFMPQHRSPDLPLLHAYRQFLLLHYHK